MKTRRALSVLPQPPLWCRAALYAAIWPRPEFVDYRLRLQRKYRRTARKQGVKAADREARREGRYWIWVAGWRVARSVSFYRIAG